MTVDLKFDQIIIWKILGTFGSSVSIFLNLPAGNSMNRLSWPNVKNKTKQNKTSFGSINMKVERIKTILWVAQPLTSPIFPWHSETSHFTLLKCSLSFEDPFLPIC